MKRSSLLLSLLLLAACHGGLRGSGTTRSESRPLPDFDEIAVSNGIQAEVKVGAKGPVEVRGDDNLVPLIETEVSGHQLRIRVKGNTQIDPTTPIHVTVLAADATSLEASSGATLSATGINNAACAVRASSGAHLDAAGSTADLDASASSGAHADASALHAKSARAEVSSGASLKLHATDEVSGSASSGGSIRVAGKPAKRSVTTSSGASVDYD